MNQPEPQSFAYRAQTHQGAVISGSIEAADAQDAQRQLTALQLRVIRIDPGEGRAPRARALGADDFMVFNHQLAQLTAAGLPVEAGLRLIAQDVRSPRLRRTIDDVAADMESGMSLADAFDKHRSRFPAMYSDLVDAGVRSGRLPGVLLNLGRHIELVQRLQATLWRALAYPAMIVIAILLVLAFVSLYVMPQFESIFDDFDTDLPQLTRLMLQLTDVLPAVIGAILIAIGLMPLISLLLRQSRTGRALLEPMLLAIPLIGPVLRRNLTARWCDALRLGVEAGLDMPHALHLAADAIASPAMQLDSTALANCIRDGGNITGTQRLLILPATVPAVIDQSSNTGDLAGTLTSLSEMYQQEAEWRMAGLGAIIAPLVILFLGATVGTMVIALFLPLAKLVTELT